MLSLSSAENFARIPGIRNQRVESMELSWFPIQLSAFEEEIHNVDIDLRQCLRLSASIRGIPIGCYWLSRTIPFYIAEWKGKVLVKLTLRTVGTNRPTLSNGFL